MLLVSTRFAGLFVALVIIGSLPAFGSENAAAVRLPDGKVLVTGGFGWWSIAYLVDPAGGGPGVSATPIGAMTTQRAGHTATLLKNGKVLLAGGFDGTIGGLRSTELYDPAIGTFKRAADMTNSRVFHRALELADGRVLLVGGHDGGSSTTRPAADAEIYDPESGRFSFVGVTSVAAMGHVAVTLRDGRVLIAGGDRRSRGSHYCSPIANAELFDPVSGTFTATGSMVRPRCYSAAAPLADGGAMIVGGFGAGHGTAETSIEVYDARTGTFREIQGKTIPRFSGATATLLADGRVLIAGGWEEPSPWEATASAEIFDPTTDRIHSAGNLLQRRAGHAAVLLEDGRVLLAGGGNLAGGVGFEIFAPRVLRRRAARR